MGEYVVVLEMLCVLWVFGEVFYVKIVIFIIVVVFCCYVGY